MTRAALAGAVLALAARNAGAAITEIESSTDCPGSADVTSRLRQIGTEVGVPGGFLAEIVTSERVVQVRMLRADRGLVAERRFDAQGSCAELAETAAVILATWQARLEADEIPAPLAVRTPARHVAPLAVELGAGVLVSEPRAPAAGAAFSVDVSPSESALGVSGTILLPPVTSERLLPGADVVTWTPAVTAAARARLRRGALFAELRGGPGLALLSVRGDGFRVNHGDTSWTFVAHGSFRVGVLASRVGVVAGLEALWQAREATATWSDDAGQPRDHALDRAAVVASVGLLWRAF